MSVPSVSMNRIDMSISNSILIQLFKFNFLVRVYLNNESLSFQYECQYYIENEDLRIRSVPFGNKISYRRDY
jgi:hypothetical protein